MPRVTRIPSILRAANKHSDAKFGPRLWNAKRRIKGSRGLTPPQYQHYLRDPMSNDWRDQVSDDVKEFVDKVKLLPEEKAKLLRNPSQYFSRPYNVPTDLRNQVYLPLTTITLMRTPHLPPKYAAFDVPLHFNKLDLKSYLKEVYGVEVVHIRTTVVQEKVRRRKPPGRFTRGSMYRPASKKKMTIQMYSPFVWPEQVTDFTPWEKETFWKFNKAAIDQNRKDSEWSQTHPNEDHRRSIADQAKDLLAGKTKWKPTWQSIPVDVRAMEGRVNVPPL